MTTAKQGVKNIKGKLHVNAGIIIQKLWQGKLKFFFFNFYFFYNGMIGAMGGGL